MEELLLTKIPVVATLTAVFFLLTAAQTLHALFLAARKSGRPVSAATVYETLLVVHLYLATATMLSAYANHGVLLLHLRVTALPLSALLWFNLALAVVGLTLAIRYRKPVMTWEIVLFALCSPPVIDAAGAFAPYLFIADAAFLTFRVSAGLILDIRRFRNSITRLSAIEAVDRLPEGLAIAEKNGRVLYTNDAMRWCLMELGFATDLSDVSMLWENLCEIAERGAAPINDCPRACASRSGKTTCGCSSATPPKSTARPTVALRPSTSRRRSGSTPPSRARTTCLSRRIASLRNRLRASARSRATRPCCT